MAIIYTRATKGSALTWTEGDANITNLNNDKIESVSEDTTPSLGGNLNVNGNSIVSSSDGNITLAPNGTGKVSLDGVLWPKVSTGGGGSLSGTVTSIDDVRTPNTITLSNFSGISGGDEIIFTGTDVTSAGLIESASYYIAADVGGGAYEISDGPSNPPITLTALGSYTDFNYTVTLSGGGSGLVGGEVLTYNTDNNLTWVAPSGGGGIASVSADTNPSLGGNLDVSSFSIISATDTNIVLAPAGNGKSLVNNINYNETPHSLGTTSGTVAPDVSNGNVQSITLDGNLTLNAFTSPIAGQSLTLIIDTNGTGRTLTSSMLFAGGEKTLSTTDTTDIISVFYDGTNYYASLVKDYK